MMKGGQLLCRLVDACHLRPPFEHLAASHRVLSSRHAVAAKIEEIAGRAVGGAKALRCALQAPTGLNPIRVTADMWGLSSAAGQ
jgi:hypothetical protein